ncbi:unnamed protein product [Pleuronectes platessa]|uniref:Uncharacterized protein n=1 Tax=Pleuronectes platessa TaxID=8262 RepID=A0A9N7VTH3_PLEPL|nr:unnamed protein product [Pleuronectes platessa]
MNSERTRGPPICTGALEHSIANSPEPIFAQWNQKCADNTKPQPVVQSAAIGLIAAITAPEVFEQHHNYCHLFKCVLRGQLYDAIKQSGPALSDCEELECAAVVHVSDRRRLSSSPFMIHSIRRVPQPQVMRTGSHGKAKWRDNIIKEEGRLVVVVMKMMMMMMKAGLPDPLEDSAL